MINEDRIVDIEIKIAAQEDMLETLNRTVYQQQKKIDELETLCSAMARHIKDLQEGASEAGTALEKPPHY
ncbi:SlyX family protein [Noviherbaspirillum massiliense]|uniref:SlyX family protein n=1 Tax=Noviherbaspirillum massiliense TaxID=1465823 RepID=UPI000554A455|nr:SlyX family protein [Noviherbaspirillum massiliense]